MAGFKRFEEIHGWQRARNSCDVRGFCVDRFGGIPDYGTSVRAVSAMSNIAEGYSRRSDRDFARMDAARAARSNRYSTSPSMPVVSQEQFDRLYPCQRDGRTHWTPDDLSSPPKAGTDAIPRTSESAVLTPDPERRTQKAAARPVEEAASVPNKPSLVPECLKATVLRDDK